MTLTAFVILAGLISRDENFQANHAEIHPVTNDPGLPMNIENIAPAPSGRLLVKRFEKSITRTIPKPIVIVDSREQKPYSFAGFQNWIRGTVVSHLDAGDYSVVGMENVLRLERKSLTDLISTVMHHRQRFLKCCEALAAFTHRGLLIEATYENIKSFYDDDLCTLAHPNAVSGTLDAIETRFAIPVIYTSRHRALAEEKAASWLSKHFTYWHLEKSGLGRVLITDDF